MKRFALACALVACGGAPRAATVSLPDALPSPPSVDSATPPLPEIKVIADVADFTSERGTVHLVREGGAVAGRYGASGVMTCTLASERFDCQWYENTIEGHATFVRKPSGKLEGSWGNGASTDDGGSWTLAPITGSSRSPFAGAWDTNFGEATIHVSSPDKLAIVYRDGTMQCDQRTSDALACEWVEGGSHGHATLTVESPRVMRGTWGNDQSTTDGGSWVFVRR